MTLLKQAERMIANGGHAELTDVLNACLDDGGIHALSVVQRLYEDMYDGITFNYEFKLPAALCLIRWREAGLQALVEAALRSPTVKNLTIAMNVLAAVGTDANVPLIGLHHVLGDPARFIQSSVEDAPELPSLARDHLTRMVLSVSDKDALVSAVSGSIQHVGFYEASAVRQIVAAIAARWLAVSQPVLDEFHALIANHADDEAKFQSYFERYPQILDPMAFQVWPRPDLHGFREPDFVIRRTDNTYVVVEIETPAKRLITRNRQLAADASQAVAQAIEYRRHLMERIGEARQHFPEFREPECLVLVGLESELAHSSVLVLAGENDTRSGLKIAGFDWLLKKAEAVRSNVIAQSVQLRRLRYV